MISVGFTGTRHGMSAEQRSRVAQILLDLGASGPQGQLLWCHHGDCVGADAEFHALVRDLGAQRLRTQIMIHPGPLTSLSAGCEGDDRLIPLSHANRNQVLVNAAQYMIAAPFEDEEQKHGGTWMTVRMARKALPRHLRGLVVIGRAGQDIERSWR